MKCIAWTMLAVASNTTAVSASDLASLVDLAVTGSQIVPRSHYQESSSRVASTGSPVDVALSVAGAFEGARQVIVQTNERAESPKGSRVTVIRDGLLDDSVRTARWDIDLSRSAMGRWEITSVTKAWRCWRGTRPPGFAALPCP
jgi:hypothetical protein